MLPNASRSQASWDSWVCTSLQHIRDSKLERVLRPLVPTGSAVQALIHQAEHAAWLEGGPSPDSCTSLDLNPQHQSPGLAGELTPLLLFSLNDYLGLSAHPAVKAAAAEAAMQVGCGPRSSALVGGFTSEHRQLELELAALKGTQDALLFPTGYAANVAVVTVLASAGATGPSSSQQPAQQGTASPSQLPDVVTSSYIISRSGAQQNQQQQPPQVVVFSDELNHASIIDGARLATRSGGAVALAVYRHNDLAHLEQLLAAAPATCRKLVVTDSLFSMDGDFADLQGLVHLKQRWGFLLVADEAHATLVCGHNGGGAAEMMGVAGDVDVHVGTLSKAAGSLGGFVACGREMRALLLNRGRSVVYSTALPVPVVAAARAALRVAHSEAWRRQHLWSLTRLLSQRLGVPAASPIIPLVVGSEAAALQLSSRLLQQGYHVPAIRPPTVPAGTCRLRVSLSAGHTRAQVEGLVAAVQAGLEGLPGLQLVSLPHLMDPRQQRHMQQEQQREQQQQDIVQQVGGAGQQPMQRSRL